MILDILALLAWGILLVRYWFTGQLKLLIHPNYFGLVLATGIVLIILAIFQILNTWGQMSKNTQKTILSPSLGSGLLLLVAVLGFVIGPGLLGSEAALHRGVRESLPLTQTQVQYFQVSNNPEERSLLEWVRTLNAYPEPDAYNGQPVKVTGFVIHDPQLPDNYLLVARFVITCCAVDAYSVVLPVQLNQSRTNYSADTWISVTGEMNSQSLAGERKLVIKATNIEEIPTPSDPYAY